MKFRKISERVRGGKLDPLSKMGKSKLTGQEVAKYYKDNPKAKMAAKDKTVKKAIELALDLGGSYTQAIKEIEKLKRGLSKMPVVQQALKTANEDMTSTTSVAMPDGIPLGKVKKTKVLKRKDLEEGKKENKKAQTELNEETMLYRIRDIQKPEMDKFKSSARLMKLKINIKQSPMKKETLIRLQGSKKQIKDFDAVVRGKSSYGDPSVVEDAVERAKEMADLKAKHKREAEQEKDEIQRTKDTATEDVLAQLNSLEEQLDLLEKQYAVKGTEFNEESATMKKVRQVVKKKGMMNIDGMKLDLTTASMISSVYDKVNSQNKKRMDKLKLPQLVNLTMKVAGKSRKESVKEAVSPNQKAILQRVKERFPRLGKAEQEKIAKIVKPKGQIDSTLYLALGNAYDKRDLKALKTLMTNYGKKYKIEAVSPAQQAAIAISKKERGEKPKNECADEKDFKPHKMYKGDKEVMANTYADHMKFGKMGYTHEKPKSEALDAKDKPFVKDLVKKLRGGSKTHAKQADDLEKAINTESMSRAKADAMRDMGKRKDKDDDGYGVATKDDRKAADKNVVMQIRKVTDLQRPAQIELRNGKKVMLKPADAKMMMKKFDAIRKPQDRLKVQNAMNDKKMTVQGLKRLLGR